MMEIMLPLFHLHTLDLSTYSSLHPAEAAGFARGLCFLSIDTSQHNKSNIHLIKNPSWSMLPPGHQAVVIVL